jgi:hypothetical protein
MRHKVPIPSRTYGTDKSESKLDHIQHIKSPSDHQEGFFLPLTHPFTDNKPTERSIPAQDKAYRESFLEKLTEAMKKVSENVYYIRRLLTNSMNPYINITPYQERIHFRCCNDNMP